MFFFFCFVLDEHFTLLSVNIVKHLSLKESNAARSCHLLSHIGGLTHLLRFLVPQLDLL